MTAQSRFTGQPTYTATDRRGRTVIVVMPPGAPAQNVLGYHVRKEGQHLDHLAYRYLNDATAFWRICELNDVMHAEQLSEAAEIAIPNKGSSGN